MNPANRHRPPHRYNNDCWYMITSSTVQKNKILQSNTHKQYFSNLLKELSRDFEMTLMAWVILDDHYHILIKVVEGTKLPKFVQQLHGRSSHHFNELDRLRGRQVWQNYWDTCIRAEIDFWKRFNYIHQNPVKHGYVKTMKDWEFSSYRYYLQEKGKSWLDDIYDTYPIIDYSDEFE
jgi:putative transposase